MKILCNATGELIEIAYDIKSKISCIKHKDRFECFDSIRSATLNPSSNVKDLENSILQVDGKNIRLGDVAKVEVNHPQTTTLSTFKNNQTITLVISKGEDDDEIKLSKKLQSYIKKIQKSYKGVIFNFYQDTSKLVEDGVWLDAGEFKQIHKNKVLKLFLLKNKMMNLQH